MIPFYEFQTDLLSAWQEKDKLLSFPLHLHDHIEMIYIERGEVGLRLLDELIILKEGDFAILFPYTAHGYEISNNKTVDYYMSIFRTEDIAEYKEMLISCHPISPVISKESLHTDIINAMKEFRMLANKIKFPDTREKQLLIHALIGILFARAIPKLEIKPNTAKYEYSSIIQAITYINNHYKEAFTLSKMAEDLNMNKFTLSRLFNEQLHIGFSKYINNIRIDNAKNLLTNTEKPIIEICYECGYESLRTFNRVFLQTVNTSPRQYRTNSKNSE